tara:strand:+ start:417 stop:578 length:162 start_codon:yes stop_codon:yes gene_type:complete
MTNEEQKKIDYAMFRKLVDEHTITMPLDVNSILWNQRMERILTRLDEKFNEAH